uniref:AAA+ ATPase domain-containing protein n=1 Tax=Candidatus Kentrum sp. UNK TaxID=2126344 RepID=A0A451B107_9GAMM|nr:MAG: hypothetical protein BECKUNK1418G_GA0071005_10884 [Candidatus Kentron sp. UNK]VFK71969.1 MAG: hypothetical protein BECKUNK1418H_GA0071006_10894 [Candidatus Kentron sp. UNK]
MTDLRSTLEESYRASARGFYTRWLARRFGKIDFLQTKEGEEKIHLGNIYVPARLDTKDRRDEDREDAETPGRDAREVIAEHPFVAISGRPGSGKTTLVHALIGELCSGPETPFRRRLVGSTGIVPAPLILRDYQDELPHIETFPELLERWWRRAVEEAGDKHYGFTLDRERLHYSVVPEGDGMPMLVFFDGIDEVGGAAPRGKVLAMACEAVTKGHRVVLTGRPSSFEGLESLRDPSPNVVGWISAAHPPKDTEGWIAARAHHDETASSSPTGALHHIQPFVRPQITQFLERFYRLNDDWKSTREQSIAEFEAALEEREYLLVLARRPIFLTLMALIHANDRRMPHGRADLYRRIIDLYLIRQTHQRRLRYTTDGSPMPHWDEREVRRALGFLAWRSQRRGAETENATYDRDKRQVIWSRAELAGELMVLLAGKGDDPRRFRELKPENGEDLLRYYLHPAGLLVEPAEGRIQFAHLSFQEYLCAEYLHGHAMAAGSRQFLDKTRELLLDNLGLPGWDEIGMLFLTVHAAQGAQAQGAAHLEILAELDLAKADEARLLVAALAGRELDFEEEERIRWLPLAVAAALLHPVAEFAKGFGDVAAWRAPGLALVIDLLGMEDPWSVLLERIQKDPPGGRVPEEWEAWGLRDTEERPCPAEKRWRNPQDDASWEVNKEFGPADARASALLIAIADAGWGLEGDEDEDPRRENMDTRLEAALTHWLRRTDLPLYHIDESAQEPVPKPTYTGFALDTLVPAEGALWSKALSLIPLDAWLLQGENWMEYFPWDIFSQPLVLLALYPASPLPPVTRLTLMTYQALLAVELLAAGKPFGEFSLSLSLSLSRSRSRSLSRKRSRSLSRSQSLSRSRQLAENARLSLEVRAALQAMERGRLEKLPEESLDRFALELERFGYRFTAFDWFAEQAEDPELMTRRGLRPGEPLPRKFGLFDEDGRPKARWPREGLVKLRDWLDRDEEVLDWTFPPGSSMALAPAEREGLLTQLARLRRRPWSPQAALDALLADWPETEPWRETTLAAAEAPLLAACREIGVAQASPLA